VNSNCQIKGALVIAVASDAVVEETALMVRKVAIECKSPVWESPGAMAN
jgi:hypothetical protein